MKLTQSNSPHNRTPIGNTPGRHHNHLSIAHCLDFLGHHGFHLGDETHDARSRHKLVPTSIDPLGDEDIGAVPEGLARGGDVADLHKDLEAAVMTSLDDVGVGTLLTAGSGSRVRGEEPDCLGDCVYDSLSVVSCWFVLCACVRRGRGGRKERWAAGETQRYFSSRGTTVSLNRATEASHVMKATPMGAGVRVISVRLSTARAAWRSFSRPARSLDPGLRSRAAGVKPVIILLAIQYLPQADTVICPGDLPNPPALDTCPARVPLVTPFIGAEMMTGSFVLGNHSCSLFFAGCAR